MKTKFLIAFFVLGTIMLTAMRSRPVYEAPTEQQATEQSILLVDAPTVSLELSEAPAVSLELVCVGNWCCTDTYCCQLSCEWGRCCFPIATGSGNFKSILESYANYNKPVQVPWASLQTF